MPPRRKRKKEENDALEAILTVVAWMIMIQEIIASIFVTLLLVFLTGLFVLTISRMFYDQIYKERFTNSIKEFCIDNLFILSFVTIIVMRNNLKLKY